MYKNQKITVVVPAHNEEAHIAQVVHDIPALVDHIVIVDDASSDSTSEKALETGDSRVSLLRLQKNRGVGGAMKTGYLKALELGSDIVVKMDGDGQMDPAYLTALLDPLIDENVQYSKGNRFLASKSLAFMPRHRLIGNIGMTFLTKLASGYWNVFDPQNGYTAIRSKALSMIALDGLHEGYFFENDMLCHLNYFGMKVKDVSIPAKYGNEISGLNPVKVGLSFPFLLVKRFLQRIYQRYVLRDFSPIALFLFFGVLTFGWGSLFGVYIWFRTMVSGIATPTGTIMLSLLPLILGFQLLLQALILDIQETPK